ncbi:sigma-54-dependent Fis family transcriptional regulator, partial [candidate division WOR-3 bacterium]|nr:sigma-54-dependent Fis family transcriptional regulator [candidate division WOR-3 bacterium]
MPKILIIDDDKDVRWTLSKLLNNEGYKTLEASDGKSGISSACNNLPDLIFLDIKLPDLNGIEVLRKIKELSKDLIIIVLTGYGTIDNAVRAIKIGAYDYITKPFDIDKLKVIVKNALELRRISKELSELKKQTTKRFKFGNMIGQSKAMQGLYNLIETVAPQDITVFIHGESGTGKELLARAIHNHSKRKDGPFQAVDCATLPETLVESELFGYEKGAFTGANTMKLGKFELANKGTLFLDEVGNLTSNTQMKLLRVLQERKIERLGGKKTIRIDVRVIAATNKDLKEAIKKEEFREDLYYRLNVFSIKLPPLRERKGDILLLTNYFIKIFNKQFNKNIKNISPETVKLLEIHSWHGNVRELENAIQHAVVLARTTVLPEHLPSNIYKAYSSQALASESTSLREETVELEKKRLSEALKKTGGSLTEASKLLGISFRSIRY